MSNKRDFVVEEPICRCLHNLEPAMRVLTSSVTMLRCWSGGSGNKLHLELTWPGCGHSTVVLSWLSGSSDGVRAALHKQPCILEASPLDAKPQALSPAKSPTTPPRQPVESPGVEVAEAFRFQLILVYIGLSLKRGMLRRCSGLLSVVRTAGNSATSWRKR